jgi:hypothetical protein
VAVQVRPSAPISITFDLETEERRRKIAANLAQRGYVTPSGRPYLFGFGNRLDAQGKVTPARSLHSSAFSGVTVGPQPQRGVSRTDFGALACAKARLPCGLLKKSRVSVNDVSTLPEL